MTVLLRWLILISAGATLWNCSSAPRKTDPVEESRPAASKEPPADKSPDTRPVDRGLRRQSYRGIEGGSGRQLSQRLAKKVRRAGYRYRVVNAGVSGDTSAQGLNRLSGVRTYHPVVVILELGANDGLRGIPVSTTSGNLDSIITQLKRDGSQVCCSGCRCRRTMGRSTRRLLARLTLN